MEVTDMDHVFVSADQKGFTDYLDQVVVMDQELMFPHWSLASWEQIIGRKDYVLQLASSEDQLLAFALWHLIDEQAHLLKIAVVKHYRRHSLGKGLLKRAHEELQCASTFLEVKESNEAAVKLYQSMGYDIMHRQERYYETGDTALKMMKNL